MSRSCSKVTRCRNKPLRLEPLESRVLLSVDGPWNYLAAHPVTFKVAANGLMGDDELAPMPDTLRSQAAAETASAGAAAQASAAITYSTLANGMPILNSRPTAPATIFIDFDGDTASGTQPYDEDGDATTFNTTEQANVAECWRQMTLYYAMFDVSVTTIQPTVSTTRTAWDAIGNNINGGYSYVGVFPNSTAESWNNSGDARTRVSGIAHEIGHNFGNGHQATYDLLANKTAEYAGATDALHGPLMGVDYAGTIHKWIIGHTSGSPSTLEDDMAVIANAIKSHAPTGYTGDGYVADDYGGTIATATPLAVSGVTQSATGIIERLADADAFSFTSAGGRYYVGATRDAPSGVDLKLSVYDVGGNLLASEDGDPAATPLTMVNDQQISMTLPAGTYYAIVSSHGNYGDQGQYNVIVNPLPAGWSDEEVGLVGQNAAPGYAGYDAATGTYTVASSGSDIYSTADSFQYAYQTLQGDGTIIARVNAMDSTAASAKAGVMIRESLASNSRQVDMVMSPQNGARMFWRASTGGSTSGSSSSSVAFTPTWVKLVRSGNTFTGYKSSDGAAWTQVSQTTVTMNAKVYVGLATCAVNQSKLNVATYTNVSLTGTINPGPTLNALAAPGGLTVTGTTAASETLSWNAVSGATGYTIERSSDGATFTQIGTTAAGVTTYSDAGLAGDQRYFYQVRAQDAAGVSAASGIASAMTRADAVRSLTVTSWTASQVILNWREASGETGYRIERSADGSTGWTSLATVGVNVPSYTDGSLTAATQYYYRVVTLDAAGDSATSATATGSTRLPAVTGMAFTTKAATQMGLQWTDSTGETSYRIERSTDGSTYSTLTTVAANVTTYTDATVSPLGEYYYRVIAVNALTESVLPTPIFAAAPAADVLPSPWASQDIGSVAGTGAAGYASGTFTLVSNGSDIWGTADKFRYVYQSLPGDGWIAARVATVENTGGWAKEGVMIRESLAANSRYAFAFATPSSGTNLQYRASTGGSAASGGSVAATAPTWVKLIRSGNTFTAQSSTDGTTWTTVGTTTITMGTTVYIGIAGDSNTSTTLNTSTFDNITVSNHAPTVATAASATPNPVAGTSTTLAALGADVDTGEGSLTYTWATTGTPPAAVAFGSTNGTNAGKSTTATFTKAGSYTFQVTITDSGSLSTTSSVAVTVNQTLTSITVNPATVSLNAGQTQQFTATASDQFGTALAVQPTFAWGGNVGPIDALGLLTASNTSAAGTVTATSGGVTGTSNVTVTDHGPTVATPAAATPNPVTGTSTTLAAIGTDVDTGEGSLTYSWSTIGTPPAAVTFGGTNGSNAGKSTTATFTMAGNYTFQVTITDPGGLSTTSSVDVAVNSTLTNITVSPATLSLNAGQTQQFTATASDQFGTVLSVPLVWSSNVGSISAGGLLTASNTSAAGTVTATSGGVTGTSSVTVTDHGPTVATAAAATPNPVAGTSTTLTALGADIDTGEGSLTYTWATTGTPPAAVTFGSTNGTNAGKSTTAAFTKAGSYTFQVTMTDPGSLSVNSSVVVTVSQTLTSIAISPATVSLNAGQTQQFTAAASDQFGAALAVQPTFTWAANVGTITGTGLLTAGSTAATGTVTATSGGVTGTSNVTVSVPATKFFVVDNTADKTFRYQAGGGFINSTATATANSNAMGVAASADGSTTWVIDANKTVYVYNAAGTSLGSWTPSGLTTPTGISVTGNDVWIVDAGTDRAYVFRNAATLRSGSAAATSNFALNKQNSNPQDIATDGTTVWVVNSASSDKMYVYQASNGKALGNWSIDSANSTPTGIAIDPTGASTSIWICDAGTDRVYEYASGRARRSGSQTASTSFALNSGNASAQGIADPPAGDPVVATTWAAGSSPVREAADRLATRAAWLVEQVVSEIAKDRGEHGRWLSAVDALFAEAHELNVGPA